MLRLSSVAHVAHTAALAMATPAAARALSSLGHIIQLDVERKRRRERATKIICTVGPKTWSEEGITGLLESGMNVMRLNFSHGTHEQKEAAIHNLRRVVARKTAEGKIDFDDGSVESICAIASDTKGPEIRTGWYVPELNGEIELFENDLVEIHTDPKMARACTEKKLWVTYPWFHEEVPVGQTIFMSDGLVELRVEKRVANHLVARVMNGGKLGQQKGCNLPGAALKNLPAISEQDILDLTFSVRMGVDMIFASFIRSPEHVRQIRRHLGDAGKRIHIVSKIESLEGVRNFDSILAESDGIMVARGDLGVEIPPEKVFLAQKMMVAKCMLAGKTSIVATQMLESMVKNPRPTRAEVNDVANAVFDGADAVMLSGETASGAWPNQAVKIMGRVCQEAEAALDHKSLYDNIMASTARFPDLKNPAHLPVTVARARSEALARSAVTAASTVGAKAIVVLSRHGSTARDVARFRPAVPIIAVTESEIDARQLNIRRGIIPFVTDTSAPEAAYKQGVAYAKTLGMLNDGDETIAITATRDGAVPSVRIASA